eukprot:5786138-Prymnesium_polylepis.1
MEWQCGVAVECGSGVAVLWRYCGGTVATLCGLLRRLARSKVTANRVRLETWRSATHPSRAAAVSSRRAPGRKRRRRRSGCRAYRSG